MADKVLIYSRFPKAMMVRIGERFELMDAAGKPPHEVFTAEQLSGVSAMITAGGTPLGGAMMDKMPALRAIICYGTGYDGVDLAAAAQRKIAVGHSPAANAAAVADLAVTLMLAVTRRLLPADSDWQALFLARTTRRVRMDATISLEGQLWEVPIHLRGRKVDLRYDPFAWARVEVWHRDQLAGLARPCDKQLNAKTYTSSDYER